MNNGLELISKFAELWIVNLWSLTSYPANYYNSLNYFFEKNDEVVRVIQNRNQKRAMKLSGYYWIMTQVMGQKRYSLFYAINRRSKRKELKKIMDWKMHISKHEVKI